MNIQRNKYRDGTFEDAKSSGYDIIQLKYDGNWCACITGTNEQSYYSDTYRLFKTEYGPSIPGTFIGELLRGTQWSRDPSRQGRYFVFDVLETGDGPMNLPYADRYRWLRMNTMKLPPHWQIVQNYRMVSQPAVWQQYVIENGFEGVVYHKSTALPGAELIREKRVFTLDGTAVALVPGEGKHDGRLGAIVFIQDNGVKATVGNGFSDDERQHIFDNPDLYIGRKGEFTANAVFESGNVRHARFVRWRDET